MSEVRLAAEQRTEFGKGPARRIRRAHKVPAVMYGHGTDPRHITLPGHELMLALKTANVLLTLDIDGADSLALPKSVQRDPIRGTIEHVDLIVVTRGEKVTVDVQIIIEGDIAPDTTVNHDLTSVSVEAEATNIPTRIVLDVTGFQAGRHVSVRELILPAGTTLAGDPDALVLVVNASQTDAQLEESLAAETTTTVVAPVDEAPAED